MKKILLVSSLIVTFFANAQNVGIGTNTPHASAQLDITSSSKGVLVPRMRSTARNLIASPATGLLVYDNDTNSFWFWSGTAWQNISPLFAGWALLGNSGTSPATNFIGTTDNNSLVFKVNNQKAGYVGIQANDGNIFWGYQSGNNNTAYSNVGIGVKALYSNINISNLVAIGDSSLFTNTSGALNTAIGSKSLFLNTTGNLNTATGAYSLYANTTGQPNTAYGAYALFSNTTGYNNIAIGYQALLTNSTGNRNTASGTQSLFSNTTGETNTANGFAGLFKNETGISNTANGAYTLGSNTSGNNNTANGFGALFQNTTGYSNVAIGVNALYSNTAAYNVVAIGDSALFNNTSGLYNTAVGSKSLFENTTGNENTANGFQALYSNTTGSSNIATGFKSLHNNISGFSNTANGYMALFSNNTGHNNTANGLYALYINTSGNYNTANGAQALFSNISGIQNTADGYFSLFNNTTGDNNTANGVEALHNNTTGSSNTAKGYQALYNNTIGNYNTGIGFSALTGNQVGNRNTVIGSRANVLVFSNISNATAIGADARVDCSNCLVLGSVNTINGATSNVNVGIGTTDPNAPLAFANATGRKISLYESTLNSQYGFAVEGAQLQIYSDDAAAKISFGYYGGGTFTERMWLNNSSGTLTVNSTAYPSDARYKKQITRLQNPLEKIMAINGVEYFMRTDEFPSKHFDGKLQVGLIAQEVEKVLPQVVQTDRDGYKAIDYAKVVPLLVEGIKEQQQLIEKQQMQIDELKKVVEKLVKK
jgi:hypothetical protein